MSAHLRLRLDIAYNGANFHGWAAQPGLRTVQGELEAALNTLLARSASNPVQLTVAGRTDAGVHARGQVAHFDITEPELVRLCGAKSDSDFARARRINGVLKRQQASDVLVRGLRTVTADFDARFGALWRRYEYRICQAQAADPLTADFTAQLTRQIDFELLCEASTSLLGLHDFGAFCRAREGATSVRTLQRFEWRELSAGVYAADIQADAFCHSMVRALVGSVVAVASGRITLSRLAEILAGAQRVSEFTVMPANGLSLEEIAYPADEQLAARALQTRAKRDTKI